MKKVRGGEGALEQSTQEKEDSKKYRWQAADLLYDALRFHKSKLNMKQLAVIRGILDNFAIGQDFNLQNIKNIDRMLADVGLYTVPPGV